MKNLFIILLGVLAIVFGFDTECFSSVGDVVATVSTASTGLIVGVRNRSVYQALRGIDGISIEESYLQSEAILSNNNGLYTFNFNKNSNPLKTSHTQFLDQSDLFVTTALLLALRENDTTRPEELKHGHLQTFVNDEYWSTNAGFTKSHLNQVYAGKLEFKVADRLYFQHLNTQKFKFAPRTQYNVTAETYDSVNANEDGKYTTPQILVLSGDEDSNIQASFKVFNGIQWAATAANKQNIVALVQDGLLIRGGANKKAAIVAAISSVQ
jgi:hypothetical protein